jgi:hypothetical protein
MNAMKRQYQQVSLKQRLNLVKKVEEEGSSIKDSALELGIAYSTAKNIINVFRKTGDIQVVKAKQVESKLQLESLVDISEDELVDGCDTPSTKSKSFKFPEPELKQGILLIPFKYNRQNQMLECAN